MTSADFTAWLAFMKERGISQGDCAKLLGISNNQPKRWREHGAPPYISLACAALVAGLPPWSPQPTQQ